VTFLDPAGLLLRLLGEGRLEILLSLPEAPVPTLRTRRGGGTKIQVDYRLLLTLWLEGAELPEIGEVALDEVSDPAFRAEQLADAISDVFETHLPWSLGLAIGWANARRMEDERLFLEDDIPPELTAYLKWGVDSPDALRLLAEGVQSRRLAHSVVEAWSASRSQDDLVTWLRSQSLAEWRTLFDPTTSEMRNLLDVLRVRDARLLSGVLSGEEVEIALNVATPLESPDLSVRVAPLDRATPPTLGVLSDGIPVAPIPTSAQADFQALRETGLEFDVRLLQSGPETRLAVRLTDPDAPA